MDLGTRFHIRKTEDKQYDCHIYDTADDIFDDDRIKVKFNGKYAYVPLSAKTSAHRTPLAVVKNGLQKYILTQSGIKELINRDQVYEFNSGTRIKKVAFYQPYKEIITENLLAVVELEANCDYKIHVAKRDRSKSKIYNLTNTHRYDEWYVILPLTTPLYAIMSGEVNNMVSTLKWEGYSYSD